MENQTVDVTKISRARTIEEAIRMVLHYDVTDMTQYSLFVVKDNKEKRIKTTENLKQLIRGTTNDHVILSVKRKLKSKNKLRPSSVFNAMKTINRLKCLFSKESSGRQQNNLNSTSSKNRNDTGNHVQKCIGDKLTDIENILQSETMLMTEAPEAEVLGKVELFKRFIRDVNDSINDDDTFVNDNEDVNYNTCVIRNGDGNANNTMNKTAVDTTIDNFESTTESSDDTTGLTAGLNEAFTQQSVQNSILLNDAVNTYLTDHTEELNNAFNDDELTNTFTGSGNSSSFLNTFMDVDNTTTGLNEAFVTRYISVAVLNNTRITIGNITDGLMNMDSTDILNQCVVLDESSEEHLNDSRDWSESLSESAFGDDYEIDDLERNVFGESSIANVTDLRNYFDEPRPENTDDAIESFMNTVARNDDNDEGLSSMGSDVTNE